MYLGRKGLHSEGRNRSLFGAQDVDNRIGECFTVGRIHTPGRDHNERTGISPVMSSRRGVQQEYLNVDSSLILRIKNGITYDVISACP